MTDTTNLPTTGEWIMPPVSYIEPIRIACTFCGRPIARQYWLASPIGEPKPFCDPAHEELYVSYWIPTHGTPK